jgi:acylglycerol lipase
VLSHFPNLPLYIVAHSLGGVIALDYSLYYGRNIAGLITIAPAISYEVKFSDKLLIAIMGLLKPDFTIEKTSNVHLLTQDSEMLAKLNSDLLRHNTVTPGLGRGLMKVVPRLINEAHTIKLPFLLQYGLNDQITPPTMLRQFFDSVGSQDKQKIG